MTWQGWVNFIVGLWLVLSGFLNFSADAMVPNLVISGLIVAILSLWEELQYKDDRMHAHGH